MRFSLKIKAAAAITILFLAIMVLVAVVQTEFSRADLLDEITAAQATLVTRTARDLDQRLETNFLALRQEAQAIPADVLAEPERLQGYLEKQPTMLLLFDGLFAFTAEGRVLAVAPPNAGRKNVDLRGLEYFERSIATDKPLISRPFVGRVANRPLITMTAPIHDADGRLVAFLGGFLDLLKPNFLGGLATTPVGKTGHFFVMTRDEPSVYVVNPDPQLILRSTTEAGPVAANRRALSGFEGTIEDVEGDGKPALFSYKALTATGWILATTYPAIEALAPVNGTQKRLWLISVLLALLLAPAVWYLTLYAISPLYRLYQETKRIRTDSGRIADELTARQDEVGSLARAFNELVVELQGRTAELSTVTDASPLGMFRSNAKGRRTYCNRSYQMITGLRADAMHGDGDTQTLHPEDRERVLEGWRAALKARVPYTSSHRYVHPDGRVVWASVKVVPVIVSGQVTGYVGSVDDITARREAQQALQLSEQRLRTITDAMPAWIAYIDREEIYRFTNLAYERAFGLTREQVQRRTVREVVGESAYEELLPYLRKVLGGQTVTFEREQSVAGEDRWIEVTYIPEVDTDSTRVLGFHAMLHDITANKTEEQRLLRLSEVDGLTGLVNRVGFEQRLGDAMAAARNSGHAIALMYIDIDYFKQVNDNHGHAGGDVLLRGFAQRLKAALRASDTVARLGGDEFVVILDGVTNPGIANRLAQKILDEVARPFAIGDTTISVTASIGVALYAGAAMTAEQLLAEADSRLYAAKKAGRASVSIAAWSEGLNA